MSGNDQKQHGRGGPGRGQGRKPLEGEKGDGCSPTLSLRIPPSLMEQATQKCDYEGFAMSFVIRELLRGWVNGDIKPKI